MKDERNKIRFELTERIPLAEKLADSSLIYNVELVPEVEMVSDQNSYRIRGFLNFKGEYEGKRQEDMQIQPYLLEKSAYHNKRALKKINYRIPVDITLPANRVNDEGIIMEITSLDYDTHPNYLLVTAEIQLEGVLSEPAYPSQVEKNVYWDQSDGAEFTEINVGKEIGIEELEHEVNQLEQEYFIEQYENTNTLQEVQSDKEISEESESFNEQERLEVHFDVTHVNAKELEEPDPPSQTDFVEISLKQPMDDTQKDKLIPLAEEKRDQVHKTEQLTQESSQDERLKETGAGSTSSSQEITQEAVQDQDRIDEETISQENAQEEIQALTEVDVEPIEEEKRDVKVSISKRPARENRNAQAENENEDHREQGNTEKKRSNTVAFLSKFLSNREETMTQIKVCLVQPGESIEDIAHRYAVSPDDILRVNRLDYGTIIGGKVLKIPVRKVR
jgi:stage VI sporulation protein D